MTTISRTVRDGALVLGLLLFVCNTQAHLTVSMQPGNGVGATGASAPSGGSLPMGGYGAYAEWRVSHAEEKTYTYKIEIMVPTIGPDASLNSVKPGPIPGWQLSFNDVDTDSTDPALRRKITYKAYEGTRETNTEGFTLC